MKKAILSQVEGEKGGGADKKKSRGRMKKIFICINAKCLPKFRNPNSGFQEKNSLHLLSKKLFEYTENL